MMDLILWRHAITEPGDPDHLRKLTERGAKDAALVAQWLRSHLPQGTAQVLSSPAVRARQTAHCLGPDHRISDALSPGSNAGAVLAETGWPDGDGTLVVVGHNPWIGELAALVLTGRSERWAIRKGGLWWFTRRPGDDARPEVLVKAVISPELLR
jgi:phosphohistidine phosphatase